MRLLDPRFRYVPAAKTDVLATWRRFGFHPISDAERRARQRAAAPGDEHFSAAVGDIALTDESLGVDSRRKPELKLAG
jgi:hypothetical protein